MVFTAAVITRNTWASDISLVGHENSVEIASYNPHIFLRDPSQPMATANICSVVALGSDDNSISIWQTKCARPLIVAKEVFERPTMDLSWSVDGLTLYAVSSDGTLAVFAFDDHELEGIAPMESHRQYLTKYGLPLPKQIGPSMPEKPKVAHVSQDSFGAAGHTDNREKVTVLNVRRGPRNRDAKRRVEVQSLSSAATNNRNGNLSGSFSHDPMSASAPVRPSGSIMGASQSFEASFQTPIDLRFMRGMDPMDLDGIADFGDDLSVPISTMDDRNRRSISVAVTDVDENKMAKLKMQGWDYKRDRSAPSNIGPSSSLGLQNVAGPSHQLGAAAGDILESPSYSSVLRTRIESTGEMLEAHNKDGENGELGLVFT